MLLLHIFDMLVEQRVFPACFPLFCIVMQHMLVVVLLGVLDP